MLLLELFASPSTLYVNRPLIDDGAEFFAWVKAHFGTSLAPDEFHVTVVHSKVPFIWDQIAPQSKTLVINRGGERSVMPLGDKGAVVLKFASDLLQTRWKEFCDAGATWDWDEYQPHVTITYDGSDLDLDSIPPYNGTLRFGAEQFAPVTEYKPNERKT